MEKIVILASALPPVSVGTDCVQRCKRVGILHSDVDFSEQPFVREFRLTSPRVFGAAHSCAQVADNFRGKRPPPSESASAGLRNLQK